MVRAVPHAASDAVRMVTVAGETAAPLLFALAVAAALREREYARMAATRGSRRKMAWVPLP